MNSIAPVAVASLTLALLGCSSLANEISHDRSVQSHVHRVLALPATGNLNVKNVAGSVNVVAWNAPRAQVDAVVYGRSIDEIRNTAVDVHLDGDSLVVETTYPHDGASGASVDYTIHVPAGAGVRVANVAGDIAVDGTHAAVEVADTSGNVVVRNVDGDLKIATTAGNADASVLDIAAGGRVSVSTVSGSVRLHVPRSTSARVTAGSVAGSFSSDFPVRSKRDFVGVSASGTLGSGAATIHIETVSGSIALLASK
ncbi:MAG TPA: DUF4097 family beta strand repeat-containing protein [Candidatus Baltobacteraceae bacterium]